MRQSVGRWFGATLAAGLLLTAGGALGAQAPSAAPSGSSSSGSAATASPAVQTATMEQVLEAARATAPGLKLAQVALDSARSQLVQAQATNGLSLDGKGGYAHQGNVPGTTAAVSTTPANAENLQGGLTLSGPATSVGLTASHTIGESTPADQVSGLSLSASQTVFDGFPGGRASAAVQQARDTYSIAQITYDAALKSTVYQARQAYYTLLGDQDTVGLRQATVTQAEQNLAYYQGLFNAQRATSLEVL
ncbi:MAG TPA: TolC family protein, partial [bacterium]|nr:TolC family protein [bacterium]